jgi:uncharacterized surface protein with fasciclin (FAS1) repeats
MANLLNTIFKIEELSIFSSAIKVTSIDKIIDEKSDFTIFAPQNLAFMQLPNIDLQMLMDDISLLTQIVSMHIVPGLMSYQNLLKLCEPGNREVTLTSIDGSNIHVNLIDGIEIGEATVLSTDPMPSNGIVHTIDRLLMSNSIAQSIRSRTPS